MTTLATTRRKPKRTAQADRKARRRPPVVEVAPPRCPKCGSAARTRYTRTKVEIVGGPVPAGDHHLATRWIYRETACAKCGTKRVERWPDFRMADLRRPDARATA